MTDPKAPGTARAHHLGRHRDPGGPATRLGQRVDGRRLPRLSAVPAAPAVGADHRRARRVRPERFTGSRRAPPAGPRDNPVNRPGRTRCRTQSAAAAAHGPLLFAIAAWGLLGALQYSSAVAWEIPTRKFPGKSRAFLRLAGSLLLFGGVLYVSMAVRRAGLVAGMAGFGANALGVAVGLLGLAWILPRRSKEWFWLLPGVAVSSAGYLALQLFATFYLPERLSNASETYGAMGIALTVLAYLFVVGVLLWLMMLVNAVVWQQRRDDPPGVLRRIADRVPLPTTAFGSGYVAEDDVAETVGSALDSFPTSSRGST
ncbi:MAG: YhjD/YihY/BrkB family envelope integrity protein [Microthrixaceae bacterium]